jgi:hypothetical protein
VVLGGWLLRAVSGVHKSYAMHKSTTVHVVNRGLHNIIFCFCSFRFSFWLFAWQNILVFFFPFFLGGGGRGRGLFFGGWPWRMASA